MRRLLKKAADGLLAPFGLEIRRKRRAEEPANLLEVALEAVASAVERLHVVQVGANDGYHGDPIHDFLMAHREHTRALLIEPQPEIIRYLEATYREHPQVTIYNGAVGSTDPLVLYRVRPSLWTSFAAPYLPGSPPYRAPSGVTSSHREHVLRAVRRYLDPGADAEEAVEAIEVPCRTLPELLTLLAFPQEIHLLQVDTEGADDQVIYACDVAALRPRLINFESQLLGRPERAALESFLGDHGYTLHRWSDSDTLALLHPRARTRRPAGGLSRGRPAVEPPTNVPPGGSAATAPPARSAPGA